jgi:predicted HAD superfamily phosphohydrolase YqeG
VRAGYEEFGRPSLLPRLTALAAKTVIFDVEPLVADWDSGQDVLDRGIARVLDELTAIPGVLLVCFATNSSRQPSVLPQRPGLQVEFVTSARKPLRTAPYRGFPQPGVVIGDQVLTDGLLARRLGYTFLHFSPAPAAMPRGPRLLSQAGELVRPILFARDPGRRQAR